MKFIRNDPERINHGIKVRIHSQYFSRRAWTIIQSNVAKLWGFIRHD